MIMIMIINNNSNNSNNNDDDNNQSLPSTQADCAQRWPASPRERVWRKAALPDPYACCQLRSNLFQEKNAELTCVRTSSKGASTCTNPQPHIRIHPNIADFRGIGHA